MESNSFFLPPLQQEEIAEETIIEEEKIKITSLKTNEKGI